MKKVLVLVAVAGLAGVANADYTENFEAFTGTGWDFHNQSNPLGVPQGYFLTTDDAHSATTSLAVNYQAGSGTSTLSDWAMLPLQTLNNGDTFSFWSESPFTSSFPDRLQVRMSTNGASSDTGTSETDVGDYSNLLLDINPTYSTSGYPLTWAQFTVTISGLSGPTSGRLAFRYFVENGGPSGANSDVVLIDDLAYTSVPAPASLALLGLAGVAAGRRRR